jgi:hypothetical protein
VHRSYLLYICTWTLIWFFIMLEYGLQTHTHIYLSKIIVIKHHINWSYRLPKCGYHGYHSKTGIANSSWFAQCSGYPTYWNTSYDKEEYLADQKSFISSLYILFSKEHVFMVTCLVYIEYQNFTRIHIREIILKVLILFEESNCL